MLVEMVKYIGSCVPQVPLTMVPRNKIKSKFEFRHSTQPHIFAKQPIEDE